MLGLLGRSCLRDAGRLLAFFALTYLGLISLAISAPLVRAGAPLGDILALLPDQLALPATLALPLALATALLATLGRMREDGELVALQAVGISPVRPALATLPVAIAVALAVGVMAHVVLPAGVQRYRAGKANLLRQALALQVAQQKPIHQDEQVSVAADGLSGWRLEGVIAYRRLPHGGFTAGYAPGARWVTDPDPDAAESTLRLELERARLLHVESAGDGEAWEISAGRFAGLVYDFTRERPDPSDKADTKPTAEVARWIVHQRRALRAANAAREPFAAVRPLLDATPVAVRAADVASWMRLAAAAMAADHPVAAVLGEGLAAELAAAGRAPPPSLRRRVAARLDAGLAELSVAARDHAADLPRALNATLFEDLDEAGPERRRLAGRILLDDLLPRALDPDPGAATVREQARLLDYYAPSGDDGWVLRRTREAVQKELRAHELAWHLRWALALAALAYWPFACGLGLAVPAHNRLVAVFLGVATGLGALLPAFALVKGLRGHLSFNPAWALWPPLIAVAVIGAALLWRRR